MEFKDSQTYRNLQKAFEGELKASAKYSIYGSKAREDGFQQIGDIFDETSRNEREHAEIWLKQLNNGQIPNTLDNLASSAREEAYLWKELYREFSETAYAEGYRDLAQLFFEVSEIERHHDYRYMKLGENITDKSVFCKKEEIIWICLNCGNVYVGMCAPEVCPVCGYPQGYYETNCENY